MNFKIGDRISISEDVAGDLKWFNRETYTIVEIYNHNIILDRKIPILNRDYINLIYVMKESELRRKKLNKLKLLNL